MSEKNRKKKLRVLFLCTRNSCRSQMAEAWTRKLKGDAIEPFSAGTEAGGLDPMMIEVMEAAGVDMAGHRSKAVDEFLDRDDFDSFDFVVTVCDQASEACPFFPGDTVRVHAGFEDPPALAAGVGAREEKLGIYRRVRDSIKLFAEKLPQVLEGRENNNKQ